METMVTGRIVATAAALAICLTAFGCGKRAAEVPGAPGFPEVFKTLNKQTRAGDKLVSVGPYAAPYFRQAGEAEAAKLNNLRGSLEAGASVWLAAATSDLAQPFRDHPFNTVASGEGEKAYTLAKLALGPDVKKIAVPGGDFEPTTTTFFEPDYVYKPEQNPGYTKWCGFGKHELAGGPSAFAGGGGVFLETGSYRTDQGTSAALFSHVMSPPIPFEGGGLAFVSARYKGPAHRASPADALIRAFCLVSNGGQLQTERQLPCLPIYAPDAQPDEWMLRSVLVEVPKNATRLLIDIRSAGTIGDTCSYDQVRLYRVP